MSVLTVVGDVRRDVHGTAVCVIQRNHIITRIQIKVLVKFERGELLRLESGRCTWWHDEWSFGQLIPVPTSQGNTKIADIHRPASRPIPVPVWNLETHEGRNSTCLGPHIMNIDIEYRTSDHQRLVEALAGDAPCRNLAPKP